jgi:16S rRNA (adenine1518-N6/adenine1519-N6)-dimethyltransferase
MTAKDKGKSREPSSKVARTAQSESRPSNIALSPHLPVSPSPHRPISPSFRPSKTLGQNFLINEGVINNIIDALAPSHDETIVEIGPGRGALTKRLLDQAGQLIAIEFDQRLIPLLEAEFAVRTNFKLISEDALEVNFCEVIRPASQARVVANLPYNISTAILQRLIEQRSCVTELLLMLQREVVERITAQAGSKERGYLSVLVEAYYTTEKLFDVAPGSFRPVPKVWSSVLRLRRRENLDLPKDEQLLWPLVSAGFAQKRKTIFNNLRAAPTALGEQIKRHGGASIILCRAEINLKRRAETLSLEEWVRLARTIS